MKGRVLKFTLRQMFVLREAKVYHLGKNHFLGKNRCQKGVFNFYSFFQVTRLLTTLANENARLENMANVCRFFYFFCPVVLCILFQISNAAELLLYK